MIGTKKLISRSRSLTWMITRTASHDSCGHTSRKCGSPFITKGYQPSTRELLDDCNYNMRKRTDASVDEARVLPILDASVILSPGQYCKNSSKSGTVAAQKLVDGRRAFGEVMKRELMEIANSGKGKEQARMLYALSGHGVPNSLFEHFISMGREWLQCQNALASSTTNLHIAKPVVSYLNYPSQPLSSAIHLALRNIPNCTIFDREKILKTNASGTTSLIQWPAEWDHDLELYLVVMNRIGSRLSSVVLKDDVTVPTMLTNDDTSTGSVIVPSHLGKWNVSIRKGEIIPFYLLPSSRKDNDLVLTIEWLYNSVDCWTIILRLQDDFVARHAASKGVVKDPIALEFEGVYVAS